MVDIRDRADHAVIALPFVTCSLCVRFSFAAVQEEGLVARVSGSQMRLVWLWLTLDEFDRSPEFENLNDRIELQKLVYLAQEATEASVYSFTPYIRGPYSRSLTRDLYGLLEPGQMSEAEDRAASYRLKAKTMEGLDIVKRIVNDRGNTPYVVWLELVASLHLKFIEEPAAFDSVWARVKDWKGAIFDESIAQDAWNSLKKNGLVEVHK